MKVNGKEYRTVWMEQGKVFMIEQNLLPFRFHIHTCSTYANTCEAIRTMIVRGAGAIGVSAGYAMAQACLQAPADNYSEYISQARAEIEATRPTARNLFYATEKVFNGGMKGAQAAVEAADAIAGEDLESSRRIGEFGNQLIHDGFNIGTHCNAGWLAFTDYGTALSPVYIAARSGKRVFVYADETRPRSQGARLTAWELYNENIPHLIVPDNATAYLMEKGKIDIFITGADRIAANGDTANKIGTLEKAILAKAFGIPFYIAAPVATFDFHCPDGSHIPIEERPAEEVLYQTGPDEKGIMRTIRVCSPGSSAINPAFDVTPAALISGIITEKGIVIPDRENIAKLML